MQMLDRFGLSFLLKSSNLRRHDLSARPFGVATEVAVRQG
jgi:hypothetical protein